MLSLNELSPCQIQYLLYGIVLLYTLIMTRVCQTMFVRYREQNYIWYAIGWFVLFFFSLLIVLLLSVSMYLHYLNTT
jgi:hypothetical protein